MKTACLIQGNLRSNAELVVEEMAKRFDLVILSTWKGEEGKIPAREKVIQVFSDKPSVPGYSHRNFQRLSTAVGLRKAREAGCDYVMKWRTDMLPLSLDLGKLIEWTGHDVPEGESSRIVTLAFRNLTVEPDWFSSMPDLFAFGHIDAMETLWSDAGFDYGSKMNVPLAMAEAVGMDWVSRNEDGGFYCAESELYAIYKDRLQKKRGRTMGHEEIAKKYLRLIDHDRLSIIWFGENGKFRPILSLFFPWWSEKTWDGRRKAETIPCGYPISPTQIKFLYFQVKVFTRIGNLRQRIRFRRYLAANAKTPSPGGNR